MGKRITVLMNDKTFNKIRDIQAQQIKESKSSVSFSRMMNEILEIGFDHR